MRLRAFLPRLFISFALSLVPLQDFDHWIYSGRVRFQTAFYPHPPAADTLILELDQETFQRLKPPIAPDRLEALRNLFFWDPAVFRPIFEQLSQEKPLAIAVTWPIAPEAVESHPDPQVETLARRLPILWASQVDPEGKIISAPTSLSGGSRQGFLQLQSDSDGEVRRADRFFGVEPSMAERLRRGIEPPSDRSPPRDSYWIRYRNRPGAIPVCPVAHWLKDPRLKTLGKNQGTTPSSDSSPCGTSLQGKIVLLSRPQNTTAHPGIRTPLGLMTREEVLAYELQSLRGGNELKVASPLQRSILTLFLIFLTAWGILSFPVIVSAIAVPSVGLFVVGVVYQMIFQLGGILIPAANATLGILITYLVFTGYRQAFQENLQWRALKQAQYLREVEQLKSNFLSLVSHDLKTPIARIQTLVETLKRQGQLPAADRPDLGSVRDQLESIETANQELRHHITSILNLSRIESQRVILNRKPNDLSRVIQQAIRRLRPIAATRQIEIEEKVDPLFSFEFDEELIRQVLTNLIDNAIKCSPDRSKVIIRGFERDGFVWVEVEDFGSGIPKDQLPLMFRKFSKIVRPLGTKDPVRGAGLGLYLSRYFIELHGGSIRVQSIEGTGTTFTFQLPLEGAEIETLLS